MTHPDDLGSGPCACFTLGGSCHRCRPPTLQTTPHVAHLLAEASEAELVLRRQLYREHEMAVRMLKLQVEAEAAAVVHGRGHACTLAAEAAWEAIGATMASELEVGERTLHTTHAHLLAAAIAALRLKTAH